VSTRCSRIEAQQSALRRAIAHVAAAAYGSAVRLHRVRVENFRCIVQQELSLLNPEGSPRPLTLIVGPNMSGKTTLLDAIHIAYEGIANARDPKWHPGLDPDDPTLRPDPNGPIEVAIDFSLHEGEHAALARLEEALGGQLGVEPAALYSIVFRWPPAGSDHGVVSARPANAQRAFRGRALTAIALSRKVVTEKILDEVGGIVYLDQNRRGRIAHAARKHDLSSALRERAVPRDVIGWLVRAALLDQKWNPQLQGESQWQRVKRLFGRLATPAAIDDMTPSDEGYDLRLQRDGRHYYSSGMSSGERQLLRLVANMVFVRTVRSVVLIDELELNLHPRWQRSVLRFCQTGGDDDNQFIVTTHSDTLLRYVDPGSVVVLGDLG
jgi:energy-coupling factor transporter ATP-binding protein EcfA2